MVLLYLVYMPFFIYSLLNKEYCLVAGLLQIVDISKKKTYFVVFSIFFRGFLLVVLLRYEGLENMYYTLGLQIVRWK